MKNIFLLIIGLAISLNISAQNTWVQKNNFSFGVRASMVSFALQGKGYCGLGNDGSSTFGDLWEYDAQNDSWSQKANFTPGNRVNAVCCECNNQEYVGLGHNGNIYYDDWYAYNPITNTWSQKANFPGGFRSQAVSFSINNKGYVATGVDDMYNLYNDLWVYNDTTNIWTSKAALPLTTGTGLRFATSFSIGGKGYVVSGYDAMNRLSTVWQYNPTSNSWTSKADAPFIGRSSSYGLSTASKGYIMGGGATGTPNYSLDDFWSYDAINDSWTKLDSIPNNNSRVEHRGFVLSNDIYILGGVRLSSPNNVYLNDVWKYSLNTGINDLKIEENSLAIFQTNNVLYGKSNSTEKSTLTVYSIIGELIVKKDFYGDIELPLSSFTVGTYIAKINQGKFSKSSIIASSSSK